jgi:hypothetical protein
MSTKHVRNAADLARFGCALHLQCRACGHSITLDGFDLARQAGQTELRELERKLVCSQCRSRDILVSVEGPPAKR